MLRQDFFGIVKGAKTQVHPKGDDREAWTRLKQRYEPNTGTKLIFLHKVKMSLEFNDVNEDPETFVIELDELQARLREDPFNEEIPNNSFMIHVLNSLPVEYNKW